MKHHKSSRYHLAVLHYTVNYGKISFEVLVRQNVKTINGASDYYSKFKNRNRATLEGVDKVSSTAATTTTMTTSKADREMMHISPSSNFQHLGESVHTNDDYEEDDYEDSDEEIETKSENIMSSTMRSTTTQPPSTTTSTTTLHTTASTSVTTAATTTSTTTTTATVSDEDYEEEEEAASETAKPRTPFFPTRMTASTGHEKPASFSPTKASPVEMSTTEVLRPEVEEKGTETNLKDLLRSGKHGNDPTKIKELLKGFTKTADGNESVDEDEINAKDIFKKYADVVAKTKPTDVSFQSDGISPCF